MNIVLAEPNDDARGFVSKCLSLASHRVIPVTTATSAWAAIQVDKPDALVTEWRFRDMGGVELIERSRRLYPTMLIVCVCLDNNPLTHAHAYEAGADNVIVKPLVIDVLLAILSGREAVRRREAIMVCGPVRVDTIGESVSVLDRAVALDFQDYRILSTLIRFQRTAVTRESLIRTVWGQGELVDTMELDRRIRRIQRALQEAGCPTAMIYLVREMGGYIMSDMPPKLAAGKRRKHGSKRN